MKFKEYLEAANKLAKDFPQVLEMICCYSSDDEGNNYQELYATPAIMQVENLNQRDVEVVGFFDEIQESESLKDQEIALIDCNAVCMN